MPRPPIPVPYRVAVAVARLVMLALTRRRWSGAEHLPEGGFLAAGNHFSQADPFTFLHFLVDHGCYPKVLAKESLFRVPGLGWLLRGCGYIPVHRGTSDAIGSLHVAEEALLAGESVAVFPEGTLTRDPGLWPMTAKTGVARLALATRVPVIPIAQWGAQRIMPRGTNRPRLRRTTVWVQAGPPVDLSDLYDAPHDDEALREATARVMARITEMLAGIRGESPPAEPFDRRTSST